MDGADSLYTLLMTSRMQSDFGLCGRPVKEVRTSFPVDTGGLHHHLHLPNVAHTLLEPLFELLEPSCRIGNEPQVAEHLRGRPSTAVLEIDEHLPFTDIDSEHYHDQPP